jgi:tetratricopeptide (TPR) repeat protein
MTARALTLALTSLLAPALTAAVLAETDWKRARLSREKLALALLEIARDDPAAAIRALDEATDLAPDDPRPRFLRVVLRVEAGEALEASAEIEKLGGMVDPAPPALAAMNLAALRTLGRAEEAKEAAKAAAAPDEGVEACLWRAWSLLRPGVERLRGAQAASVAAISAHARKNPFLGRLTLAVAYRRLGDLAAALGQARIAARHERAGAAAQLHLAEIHRLRGDRKAEAEILRRASLLDPTNRDVRARLAGIALASGDLNAAGDLLAHGEPTPAGRWVRAWVRLRFGEKEHAVEDLARALETRPAWGIPGDVDATDPRLHAGLRATIAEATERLDAADPALLPGLYLRLRGRARLGIGDHEGALADLTKAIEVEPSHRQDLAPLVLGARVEVEPDRALEAIGKGLRSAIADERLALAELRMLAHLRRKDWPAAAKAAAAYRAWADSRERDLAAGGVEPGARARTRLAARRAVAKLVEARGILAANPARAAALARELIDSGPVDVRAEAYALLGYLRVRRAAKDAGLLLEEAIRLHEPTRLRDRGRDHVLNGWVWRFVAEARRRKGDEAGSAKAFTRSIRDGLPRWAEELP